MRVDERFVVEEEIPEAKDILENKFSAIKREIKELAKKYASLKKSDEVESEEPVEKGAFKELAIEGLEKGEMLYKMIEKLRKRGMDYDVCMAAMKKKGYDTEMAKNMWEEMHKADESAAKQEKEAAKVEKSINWASPNRLLEVSERRGQNAHYNVDGYIAKGGERAERLEALAKSQEAAEPKEFDSKDINDLIEKGYDRSETDVNSALSGIQNKRINGFTVSAFSDEDMLKSLRISEEAAAEVLTQNEDLLKALSKNENSSK
jgi:hypothetical protein